MPLNEDPQQDIDAGDLVVLRDLGVDPAELQGGGDCRLHGQYSCQGLGEPAQRGRAIFL